MKALHQPASLEDLSFPDSPTVACARVLVPNQSAKPATPGVEIVLPYPPSANRYWRHRSLPKGGISTYVSKDGKQFRDDVHKLLALAGIRKPLQGRVGLDYTLYPHRPLDYRTRMRKLGDAWHDTVQCIDLDNAQKALLDALKGVAFEDDAWVRDIRARRAEPDGQARIEVRIWQIAPTVGQMDLLAPQQEAQ